MKKHKRAMVMFMISLILSFGAATLVYAYDLGETSQVRTSTQAEDARAAIDSRIAHYHEFLLKELTQRGLSEASVDVDALLDTAARQIERLVALQFGFERAPKEIAMPDFTLIVTPTWNQPLFMIGLSEEPTQEVIDFILSFTGIPSERACIGFAKFVRDDLRIPYDELDEFLESISYTIQPLALPLPIGRIIFALNVTPGYMYFGTLGHPNAAGTGFFTSMHVNISGFFPTFLLGSQNTQIGNLRWSIDNNTVDVAWVHMLEHFSVSSILPDLGIRITRFRDITRVGDDVRSYRVFSGIQTGLTVHAVHADVGIHRGKTLVTPNSTTPGQPGFSQEGDSGSALIRVLNNHDVSVLGTRKGWIWLNGGVQAGVYSNVFNY